MLAAIMLATMHQNWSLVGNARTNTVCPLHSLGPNSAEPDAPAFKLVGSGFIATMMNCNSIAVAKQNDVCLLSHDGIQPIYLILGLDENFG
jgi:hypothetical protein